jgi:DNA polymerase V
LAKLANQVAKKQLKIPVFNITSERQWLQQIEVGDVWGIGKKWSQKLNRLGVYTAYDLSMVEARTFKRKFNVIMERTILELRGISCIAIEESSPKKEIVSSKSFGQLQTELNPITEALSSYAARAVEKMRKQGSLASTISVFIRTNPFRKDLPYYSKSTGFQLINPTDDVRAITKYAKMCLRQIYRQGFHYKKVGIMLGDLMDNTEQQFNLFDDQSDSEKQQTEKLMQVLTDINHKFGRNAIHLAAEGVNKYQPWKMKSVFKSPHYTTNWRDLPVVHAN